MFDRIGTIGVTALGMLAIISFVTACTVSDTDMARQAVYYENRPAHIICTGYNGVLVDTNTLGRIEFDATGRIDFVDAKTGGLVKTEGECVVTYAK